MKATPIPVHPPNRIVLTALLLSLCGSGCRKAEKPAVPGGAPSAPATSNQAWFEDITQSAGIDFIHDPGPSTDWFFPELTGSGAAFIDFDNDGLLDIYLVQNAGPESTSRNQLYRQLPDGSFENVSAGSGVDVTGWGQGVAVGDVNNDGLPDLLVTEFARVRLFLNQGSGRFLEISDESGIDNPQWAVSAAFFDYDRDGWLDLVVANYVDYDPSVQCADKAGKPDYCGPDAFEGSVTRLFRNLGGSSGNVRFEDVTSSSGLGSLPVPALGVVTADFDGDHWPDILVANDNRANGLWINQRDGTFKDEAIKRGIAYNALGNPQANMGIAIGDVRRQGMLGIYITHLTEQSNVLWLEDPTGYFQDRTGVAGLAGADARGTGFGTLFADFDNDGWLDLANANGRVTRSPLPGANSLIIPELGKHWSIYAETNRLFAGSRDGTFINISASNPAFCGEPLVGRGLFFGDIDNDGGVDLLFTAIASGAKLFRNVAPGRGNWLIIRAVDPSLGGRDAYGAEITVETGEGRQTCWVNPGSSYAGSNDPRAHFGLGTSLRANSVQIRWPDGMLEEFPGLDANQITLLKKGTGRAISP